MNEFGLVYFLCAILIFVNVVFAALNKNLNALLGWIVAFLWFVHSVVIK